MIPAEETFNGTWPFTPHFGDASGFRQPVDEGPREAQVLICLHGEPTWDTSTATSYRDCRSSIV